LILVDTRVWRLRSIGLLDKLSLAKVQTIVDEHLR
jgi:hypothetical protein